MTPIDIAHHVEERYRRYLKTTFYFKDPQFRRSFEQALDSGRLSRGPYLEATPVFKRGTTLRALLQNILQTWPDDGFLRALEADRPLYLHQEEAIQRVARGCNVVVATGTGSGKTEAFLYPILLHLYREFLEGNLGPGVRALVLYPMNALANDQRDRLGDICKRLKEAKSPFRFTFAQYIGETPEDEKDLSRHAQDHLASRQGHSIVENGEVVHGELVLRTEMRRTPPHILLTNYSMLEYLLLRPGDSPLFDNGRARWWTFLVLDEAHQYRGARGIEMAMLLRRLKQRLREGGQTESFRCIATSATLMGGEQDKSAVAKFASDLFGENFYEKDVILGEAEPIPEPSSAKLGYEDYRVLRKVLSGKGASLDGISRIAEKVHVPPPMESSISRNVGRILQADARSVNLRRLITGKPVEVKNVADQVFEDLPEHKRVEALANLVDILLMAEDPLSGAPLLSARYHLFLRSLEGAFVSYWPEKKVFLDRKADCAAFEVALCRECGQHYFVARKNFKEGKIQEPVRDPNDANFGATFLRPIENGEEESEEDENDDIPSKAMLYLCVRCGEVSRNEPTCGHNSFLRVIREESPSDEDKADQLARCSACGYTAAGRDPVREVVHGTDGPHAVIATTLYILLPEERKKVLAFADGRQEAAFFAWYLENSYRDILSRNLILDTARRLEHYTQEGLSLRELARGLQESLREKRASSPAAGEIDLRREAWIDLYREFLTDEIRVSLEGVGLIRWFIKWPEWLEVPRLLTSPPWSLTEQEAFDIVFLLLDTMRSDRAVELKAESGVLLSWSDLKLQASQTCFRIGDPRREQSVRGWDGRMGKRAKLLAKLLLRSVRDISEEEALNEAVEVLRHIWQTFMHSEQKSCPLEHRLLLSVGDARRLNPEWYRFQLLHDDSTIYRCDTCGRLYTLSVRDMCPRHRCPGKLTPVRVCELEPNHYRQLYMEHLPGILRVEEHTAQLDKEKAREFQREFKEGKIHVLSCSTTFELGVDLGDLDTIFLRNVPPEAFNYAQRVGRAGRRRGYPGFAITYCRRSPHDLYHFAEPERMLNGTVRPPVLSLRNEKIIARHVTAVALSCFFRQFPERFRTVEQLFRNLEQPTGCVDFKDFLENNKDGIRTCLRAIVPPDMFDKVGLENDEWVERIAGDESRLALAEAEVSSDYQNVKKLEKVSAEQRDYKTAQWAARRADTISQEEVLSFLSRKAVIPKYGFPVDVVELDTQRALKNQEAFEVLLQRDLSIAISEFAPTSKIVANKKEWTSYGLKKVAGKEWQRRFYIRCAKHNVFMQWEQGQSAPEAPCGDRLVTCQYIVPLFGFITDRERPKEPRSRTTRAFSTRPYFAGSVERQPDIIVLPDPRYPLISIQKASPGRMVVLCEGRRGEGFYVCRECGAGFRSRVKSHRDPYGQDCRGTLEQVSLGHEFVTDVLQLLFHVKPEDSTDPIWFAYSLACAIVEGAAEVLEVPSTDLNATVDYKEQHTILPIVLYDNVPGGAGLVAQLEESRILVSCLGAAFERVRGKCGCDENASCYGCLRSYRNQFAHQYLQRGPVARYLEVLLRRLQEAPVGKQCQIETP